MFCERHQLGTAVWVPGEQTRPGRMVTVPGHSICTRCSLCRLNTGLQRPAGRGSSARPRTCAGWVCGVSSRAGPESPWQPSLPFEPEPALKAERSHWSPRKQEGPRSLFSFLTHSTSGRCARGRAHCLQWAPSERGTELVTCGPATVPGRRNYYP